MHVTVCVATSNTPLPCSHRLARYYGKSYEWFTNSNIKQQTRKDGNFAADMCAYTSVRFNPYCQMLAHGQDDFYAKNLLNIY